MVTRSHACKRGGADYGRHEPRKMTPGAFLYEESPPSVETEWRRLGGVA